MLKHYKLLIALFVPGVGLAQTTPTGPVGLVNNGANIVIGSSSNIYIDGTTGDFTNQNGGVIKNTSTGGQIKLTGNWANNAANTVFSGEGATIILGGSGAQTVGGTNGTSFYKLTANGGGTKTVNTAATISRLLTMEGTAILNANDNLTLLATPTTNANVAAIPTGASVTGNVKVQTYFTGGNLTMRGNRLVSTPINDAALAKKSYAQLKDYVIISGPAGGGFDLGGARAPEAVTLQKYYEPGTATSSYTNIANINESLSPASGVILHYRGDRSGYTQATASTSAKTNAPFAIPETTLMQWNGPINQGNYTVNLSFTANPGETLVNGLNLVGNPYPAYINWNSLIKTNVADYVRFIKPGGGFAIYDNRKSPTLTVNAPEGTDLRIIAPGQGFYVFATGTGASITFTEGAKSVESTPIARLLYSRSQEKLSLNGAAISATSGSSKVSAVAYKLLRMNLQDTWNKEETVAVFADGESATATTDDATFLGGSSISLASLSSDDKRLTINRMPPVNEVASMKLYVYSPTAGPVKLNFTDLSAVQGYNLYLKDAYTNKTIDVKANPSYEFSIDPTIADSYGNNRMSLLFSQATTLPVALAVFKAEKVANGAKVIWNVKSEENVVRYEVERSIDGVSFAKIKEVSDLGKATYSVIDESPILSQNYYRLKSVDADGRTDFSNVISLDYTLSNEVNVNVFPNPASDVVKVKLPSSKAVSLSIFDLSGKKLKSAKFAASSQVQENIADLQEGVYLIEVRDKATDAVLLSSKFIVKK
ncbi:T9SS type A sorting domain-containing protein [Desertivirga brevis]|uniref:T9SS type A sorting domain-containing protein n=1 Tax=Desertivirga brevis TaxID=2810310 RepID=UPI001A96408B|nr:T9SS type A sorting domain-containing protein [Pedobacter sp. SYSU D00873]